ncbi:MAG: hypothetical protein ACR2KZ_16215 [Segetibacter sp.]
MKKLLFVLALGAFAACNSGENKATMSDTSTVVTQDTSRVVTDTTIKVDTLNK